MNHELKSSTCLLILVVVALGVYYPALFAPLNSVDDPATYHYLLNTDDLSLRGIFKLGGSGDYYRPLLLSSFLADKYLWGLEESFMHLENMLFHLGNTLLVFAIARRAALLQEVQSPLYPLLAAFFFAVHPINTEAVSWISGRTDLLAGFFLLLSALVLLRRTPALWSSCLAALLILVACLAKETALFFVPAAALWPFFAASLQRERTPFGLLCLRSAPHVAVCAAAALGYLLFRKHAFAQVDHGVARVINHVSGPQSAGSQINLRLPLKALGFYAKKLVAPFPLNFGITHVSDWYLLLGVVVLALIVYLLLRRTLPGYFMVCAASVGASALLIPLLRYTWTPLAERYMYIPGAFFLVGCSLALGSRPALQVRRPAFLAALSLLASIALCGTWQRNLLWQDNLALFQDTLKKSPDFVPLRNQVANELDAAGRSAEAGAIYKSFRGDGLVNAQYGLVNHAYALNQEGNFDGARALLKKALAAPGKQEVTILKKLLEVNSSEAMEHKGRGRAQYADNVRWLSRLIELTGDPFYHYRLGIVEMQHGSRDQARQAFALAAQRAPAGAHYRTPAQKLVQSLAAEQAGAGGDGKP